MTFAQLRLLFNRRNVNFIKLVDLQNQMNICRFSNFLIFGNVKKLIKSEIGMIENILFQ